MINQIYILGFPQLTTTSAFHYALSVRDTYFTTETRLGIASIVSTLRTATVLCGKKVVGAEYDGHCLGAGKPDIIRTGI